MTDLLIYIKQQLENDATEEIDCDELAEDSDYVLEIIQEWVTKAKLPANQLIKVLNAASTETMDDVIEDNLIWLRENLEAQLEG